MTIFYSDKLTLTENPNGFVLNFTKEKSDIENEVDYGFRVGISPSTAKIFMAILYSAIGEYEDKYGEIRVNGSEVKKIVKKGPDPIGFTHD